MDNRNTIGYRISVNATAKAGPPGASGACCPTSPPIRSGPATTPGNRRGHAPCGKKHSRRSDPHNRSCRSTVPHTDHSTNLACFADKHALKLLQLLAFLDSQPSERQRYFYGVSRCFCCPERGHFFAAQSAKKRSPLCAA